MPYEAELPVGTEIEAQRYFPGYKWPLKVKQAVVRWINADVPRAEFLELSPAQRERLRVSPARRNSRSGRDLQQKSSTENDHPAAALHDITEQCHARTDAAVVRGDFDQRPFM